jgi:hypothetical protein
MGWTQRSYGLGGTGTGALIINQDIREGASFGKTKNKHVNIIWLGINGLGSGFVVTPCGAVANARRIGYEPWIMTLYSLSSVAATDQGPRDIYNYTEIQSAKACGAVGIINLADDALIGKDGTNGSSTGWTGGGAVHASAAGYAYVAQIAKRVLQAYYFASPDAWKTITAAGTTVLNGYDRYVIADNTAGAQTLSLPDCIGATGMQYHLRVKGTNTTTLQAATVSGQTEQVEGGASTPLTSGVYTFQVMTFATASIAPGGCNYVMVN